MWNTVTTDADIQHFMELTCSLHDSCIKELHYLSGAYVDKKLSMHPINDCRTLRVIIQRQYMDMPAIEMEFSGLKYLKLLPIEPEYSCEIFETSLFFKNGYIYWGDYSNLSIDQVDRYEGTIICALGLRWRPLTQSLENE